MPPGTTPRAETACSASHPKLTLPDEPPKLDRQQGFGYSSILDRGRLFFLYPPLHQVRLTTSGREMAGLLREWSGWFFSEKGVYTSYTHSTSAGPETAPPPAITTVVGP